MSAAMLLPVAAILGLPGLGLSGTLPWLSNSEHTAMLVGMLAFMLYRRERYTGGYSLFLWPFARERRSPVAQGVEARQGPAPARTG
jgi:hypothetical protein